MPFYKKQDGQLVSAEFIDGPGYTLSEAGKDEHIYPVDGWHWFDNLDAALDGLRASSNGSVTMRQARLMLHRTGVLASVETVIAAMPEPARTEAQIEWEFASEILRVSPLVSALGAALGLDDNALDALFAEAAKL